MNECIQGYAELDRRNIGRRKRENNITYYGSRYWQPIWNRNQTVGASG